MGAVGIVLGILLLAAGVVVLFLKLYPPFGGKAKAEAAERITRSPRFKGGKFRNVIPTDMRMKAGESLKILGDVIRGRPDGKPSRPPEVVAYKSETAGRGTRITWFGHSALLVETEGLKLFLDPMLGRGPSPFPGIGGQRYSKELPVRAEELPRLDAVFLSHDHYDHLDYGTIRKLKDRTERFFVPLGVGAHLIRWGVEPERIEEHDWWEETEYRGLRIVCTPARHFSGRSLTDRDSTLWCSWVIRGAESKLFYSGDSGYGPHFREIGERYGPFDLAMMECGQYDPRWAAIHMTPEETVRAHQDVRGDWLLPIHWGAFTLALHAWTDPAERVTRAAEAAGVRVTTPRIGEAVRLGAAGEEGLPGMAWWRKNQPV